MDNLILCTEVHSEERTHCSNSVKKARLRIIKLLSTGSLNQCQEPTSPQEPWKDRKPSRRGGHHRKGNVEVQLTGLKKKNSRRPKKASAILTNQFVLLLFSLLLKGSLEYPKEHFSSEITGVNKRNVT